MFNIFKFFVFLLLLPLVYSSSTAFLDHVKTYPSDFQDFLIYGVVAFFIVFFFIYQFWGLFESGQKMKLGMFKFLAPFDRIVCNILPFYFLTTMLLFYLFRHFFGTSNYDHYFMFFAGFAMTMHVILVAQDMQEQEPSPIKPTYLLSISVVIILNAVIFILMVDLVRGLWTFPAFFHKAFDRMADIYSEGLKYLSHVKTK